MSFKINDVEWQPKTTAEHTDDLMNKINDLLLQQDVKDKEGNVIQLEKNFANAFYLMALANGNKFQVEDEKLSAAINSFNLELCDDQQIENLLPIAAIERDPGTYTTVPLLCTASEDGECFIPAGTTVTFKDYTFTVQNDVTIAAGAAETITVKCTVVGPVAILSGEITAFDTTIANLESVVNPQSSTPGTAAETTNELRQRLISGNTIKYGTEGCKLALEELPGVAYARIYFNFNTEDEIELEGGVVVQPRHAYIVIYGESDEIAETYMTYMNAPTQNSPIAAGTKTTIVLNVIAQNGGDCVVPEGATVSYGGHQFAVDAEVTVPAGTTGAVPATCTVVGNIAVPAYAITEFDEEITNLESVTNYNAAVPGTDNPAKSQVYYTNSGQAIEVKYDTATNQNVFVKVSIAEDAEFSDEIISQIKRDLIAASTNWEVGQSMSSLITDSPFINCLYTKVAYTQVSTDGVQWESLIPVACNAFPRVTDATIIVEQL